MAEILLDRDTRLQLRAQAHGLEPVVLLGANGLTEAVLKEIDRALTAHELIKIRVPGDDRDEREAMYIEMADKLNAARIQMIGKLLVLWPPKSGRKSSSDAWRSDSSSKNACSHAGSPNEKILWQYLKNREHSLPIFRSAKS